MPNEMAIAPCSSSVLSSDLAVHVHVHITCASRESSVADSRYSRNHLVWRTTSRCGRKNAACAGSGGTLQSTSWMMVLVAHRPEWELAAAAVLAAAMAAAAAAAAAACGSSTSTSCRTRSPTTRSPTTRSPTTSLTWRLCASRWSFSPPRSAVAVAVAASGGSSLPRPHRRWATCRRGSWRPRFLLR